MPDVTKLLQNTLQKVHLNEKANLEKANVKVQHVATPSPLGGITELPIPPDPRTPKNFYDHELAPPMPKFPLAPGEELIPKCSDREPAAEEDCHLSVPPLARILVKNALDLASGVNDRVEAEYYERTEDCIRQMYPLLKASLDYIFEVVHTIIDAVADGHRDASVEAQRRAAEDAMLKAFRKLGELNFPETEVYGKNLNKELVNRVQCWMRMSVVQRRQGLQDWLLIPAPAVIIEDEFRFSQISLVA